MGCLDGDDVQPPPYLYEITDGKSREGGSVSAGVNGEYLHPMSLYSPESMTLFIYLAYFSK